MTRQELKTTEELAAWYDNKYREMGDGWATPPEECNQHLDDLGVPFDKSRTLLDVGCGAGHFLVEASKRVNAGGIEISHVGVILCKNRGVYAELCDIENGDIPLNVTQGDYITCMGSIEHVIDIDKAIQNIHDLLKPNGKAYFLVPNEKWPHMDQPNERTWDAGKWIDLFDRHQLHVIKVSTEWGPHQIAFTCIRSDVESKIAGLPKGDKLNCGSGQRPFQQEDGWINIDINPKWNPDLVADWNDLHLFSDDSMSLVVAHHTIEHVGCGEADGFIRESYRILKPGASLLIFVPDMRALAQRWLVGQMDDQIYMTNIYGAFMGDEADRHRWGWSRDGLWSYLKKFPFKDVHAFNWRDIPGADLSRDWWIIAMEAIK